MKNKVWLHLKNIKPADSGGFTLADVAIASAIFAGVMIVCLGAFVAMGKIYFRGSIEIKTQEASRNIVDDISRNISTTAIEYIPIPKIPYLDPGHEEEWEAYCIAGIKYSYRTGWQLSRNPPSPSPPPAPPPKRVDRVFVKSVVLDGSGAATGNCDTTLTNPRPPSPGSGRAVELLSDQMRIMKFNIRNYGRLHVIELDIAYGGDPDLLAREDEVFEFPKEIVNDPSDPFDPADAAHYEFNDDTRCELTETFCFISRADREAHRSISE